MRDSWRSTTSRMCCSTTTRGAFVDTARKDMSSNMKCQANVMSRFFLNLF